MHHAIYFFQVTHEEATNISPSMHMRYIPQPCPPKHSIRLQSFRSCHPSLSGIAIEHVGELDNIQLWSVTWKLLLLTWVEKRLRLWNNLWTPRRDLNVQRTCNDIRLNYLSAHSSPLSVPSTNLTLVYRLWWLEWSGRDHWRGHSTSSVIWLNDKTDCLVLGMYLFKMQSMPDRRSIQGSRIDGISQRNGGNNVQQCGEVFSLSIVQPN